MSGRRLSFLLVCTLPLALVLLVATPKACAQASGAPGGRLVLVLPFENRSGQPALNWISDSFPDTINQRLNSSGFLTITRDDRQYALDHLGLPADFRPTRATTILMAQTMDADYVIIGNFTVNNGHINAQAQVLEINRMRLSEPLEDSSDLDHLFDVENAVAWKVVRQIDPTFTVAEQTFLASSGGVTLSAFEDYIRGLGATAPEERLKRLKAAADSTPLYPAAQLAYGKELYAQRNFDLAAATFARVPPTSRLALEAGFYLGLARFNSAQYAAAEVAFAFVAARLPLPEVVNNQGVAAARQGKNAAPLFQRASTDDPSDADYHYNLAIALYRNGDLAGATNEVTETLRIHPDDTEATTLKSRLASGNRAVSDNTFDPEERIRRTYSEASFRQAAFQLDQMRAARMAALPPAERSAQYTQLGRESLSQGLIPEAEQQFLAAIAADGGDAAAHVGLAQLRQQSGDPVAARTEAQTSLKIKPSVDAYLVLASLDLNANQLTPAANDVSNALTLEPSNPAALSMKQAIESRRQATP